MLRTLAVGGLAALLGACSAGPAGLLAEASGSTSQTLCSKAFVSGLASEQVFAEHLRPEPGMGLIAWAIRYDVDRAAREVRTRIGGSFATRAAYAEGRGCTLIYPGQDAPRAFAPAPQVANVLGEIAGPDVVAPPTPVLAAALDAAFADPHHTQAVVIVHDGRVIAERYAPGYGVDTPLLGHSMTKSVVNALIGLLVRDGKLDMHARAPIAAWASDARSAVTIDDLLSMRAGLAVDEGSGAGIATHMWFAEPDMAAFAAQAELDRAPDTRWAYSSRSYVLLSRIIADALGGDPEAVRDYAARNLFGPLGMTSATLEFDAVGTPMGANAMFASPRDWARFGMLYLNDGVVGGQRILPEGWVRASTQAHGGDGYGAGFWLNTTDAPVPDWGFPWGLPGAPADAFMARGYMGQYVVIAPSARLVIVRMGQSHERGAAADSVGALTAAVIDALR